MQIQALTEILKTILGFPTCNAGLYRSGQHKYQYLYTKTLSHCRMLHEKFISSSAGWYAFPCDWAQFTCMYDRHYHPDSKVHGANMGPIWVLSDPGGPHVGPINLVIMAGYSSKLTSVYFNWVVSSSMPPLTRHWYYLLTYETQHAVVAGDIASVWYYLYKGM